MLVLITNDAMLLGIVPHISVLLVSTMRTRDGKLASHDEGMVEMRLLDLRFSC